jgi:hypothetical protein
MEQHEARHRPKVKLRWSVSMDLSSAYVRCGRLLLGDGQVLRSCAGAAVRAPPSARGVEEWSSSLCPPSAG